MSIPLSVPAGLLAGWGAGVAAPWPMPVAAVMTAARARQRELGTRPGAVCAAVGLGCIVGAVIEPVTCRPRLWSPATRLAIGVNLATSAALIGGRCLPCGRCVPPAPRALAVLRGWGAKRGANVGRRQATPGDNQPWFPQLDCPSGLIQPRAATWRMRLKIGRLAVGGQSPPVCAAGGRSTATPSWGLVVCRARQQH